MELLERHFDIALETPDGIKKLRELILSLAMKGKLVKQNSNEKSASELLKEITVEKNRLIKAGMISNKEPLLSIKKEEIPFIVPKGWEWIRLGDIVSLLGDGIHGTPNYDDNGEYYFINGNNLSDGIIEIKENTKKISQIEYLKYKKELNTRTVFVSINGTIGNVAFYNNEKVILGKSACYFNLFDQIDKWYVKKLLNSKYFLDYAFSSATGSTIKNVSLKSMREFPLPLPPLEEQKRIVEKIDQLMALCDKLEAERNERDKSKIKIHSTAMNRLLSAPDSAAFNSSWSFIVKHFSELYSVTQNVDELKKAILQLAVMGKLVPQDVNDQPASELLREIEVEKERLVREGKIKKPTPLSPIKPNEVPYELPEMWMWVRLREICHDWGQKTPDEKFTYIDVGAIDNINGCVASDVQILESSEAPSRARKIVKNGTVIYSTVRPYLLNIAIIDHDYNPEPIASTAFAILHPYKKIYNKYLYYYLRSQSFIDYVELQMKGVAYPAINDGNFYMGGFPLPPFNEQKRIVEKIDQLMELCNYLEQQIEDSTGKKSEILEAVLSRV